MARTAAWVCDLTYEALPPRVVDLAKACVLDQIGVQIFGATLAHAQAPYRMVQAMGAAPESTIAFHGTRTVAPYAACVNAVFASGCELDDGNPAAGHGGSPVIPTTLAFAELRGCSGRDIVRAVVAGYQVMAHVGIPIRLGMHRGGWHGVKVLGVFGAAAAASTMLGLGHEQTAHAIAIAASEASGTTEYDRVRPEWRRGEAHPCRRRRSVRCASSPARVRRAHRPGTAFDGWRGVLRVFGAAAPFEAPEDIGARFHIEDNIFKLQPAVGTVHAAVEAIEVLPRTSGFPIDRIDDIVRINVGVVDCAVADGGHISRPTDALSAQLSLAFSVALRLVRGRNAVQDYLDPGNWTDPSLLAVADKVICHATVFEPGAPELGATVSLRMADGRVLEHYQRAFRDHSSDPATSDDLERKFHVPVDGLIERDAADEIVDFVGRLDEASDVNRLFRVMTRA